jgi:SWI/SNF-related matrix-associated actin-dependent regulator 1 of chromatin subfamily A
MALLMFIMPKLFTIEQESLDTIFSIRSNESDISKRRIENAKRLMSPFVLRRKKTQVQLLLLFTFHNYFLSGPNGFAS